MQTFTFRNGGAPNEGLLEKAGLEKPAYLVDIADGMPSGATISAVTVGAVNSSNADVTSVCVSTATTVGVAVIQVKMLSCSTGGTTAPADGSRFRLRTTATLSTGAILIYDTYVLVRNPAYDPD